MASVFKRKRRVGDRVVEAAKYTIKYRNADGELVRVQGYTDQAKTWELARKLEAGADDNWLSYKRTAMSEHLEAYRLHLKARNVSPGYVADTCQRIQRALDG